MAIQSLSAAKAAGLRFSSETGSSGRFDMTPACAPAAARCSGARVRQPAGESVEIDTLRQDVERLRAEVARLACIVDSNDRGNGVEHDFEDRASANALPRAACTDQEIAIGRVDAAACRRTDAISDAANSGPDWQRTDEALANLLLALQRHANSEWERLGAAELRMRRQLARADKERVAIRRFRTRWWWKRVLPMADCVGGRRAAFLI